MGASNWVLWRGANRRRSWKLKQEQEKSRYADEINHTEESCFGLEKEEHK
jgi:hypothetical protein